GVEPGGGEERRRKTKIPGDKNFKLRVVWYFFLFSPGRRSSSTTTGLDDDALPAFSASTAIIYRGRHHLLLGIFLHLLLGRCRRRQYRLHRRHLLLGLLPALPPGRRRRRLCFLLFSRSVGAPLPGGHAPGHPRRHCGGCRRRNRGLALGRH
uniref:Uncharacterized protein n=1 Tax=Aegilops tauschii subsp. strangulata TaxID=200361 RepID=A0A453HTK6_AEGTS